AAGDQAGVRAAEQEIRDANDKLAGIDRRSKAMGITPGYAEGEKEPELKVSLKGKNGLGTDNVLGVNNAWISTAKATMEDPKILADDKIALIVCDLTIEAINFQMPDKPQISFGYAQQITTSKFEY